MISAHLSDIADTKKRLSASNKSNHQFIRSIIDETSASHICLKPLDDLKPISIHQLRPNTVHYGYKLIANIVTPPDKLLCLRTVIKDVDDGRHRQVIPLSIYNLIPFKVSLLDIEEKHILSKNTRIAIKEPFCKFDKANKLGLRMDNPLYNLVVLSDDDNANKDCTDGMTIDELKQSGNAHFKNGKYWNAVSVYSKALESLHAVSPKEEALKLKLLLNRCLCFLKLNEYNLAYIDGHNAFQMDSKSPKVQFRFLCSLTNIGRHKEALSMIGRLRFDDIPSKSIQRAFETLKQTIARRHSESMGKYTKASYTKMSHETEWESVEDFVGDIEMKMMSEHKGRGIIASERIRRGQLLLVEKAFSFGSYFGLNGSNDNVFVQSLNEQCWTAYSGRNQELILDSISKCFPFNYLHFCVENGCSHNVEDYESMECVLNKWKLLQLYDGDGNSKNKMKVLDLRLLRNRNVRRLMDDHQVNAIKNAPISAKKVNDIILSNAFETLVNPQHIVHFVEDEQIEFDVLKNERYCGCGLWIVGSLFNHSNASNAQRFVFYKHMMIKAVKDIEKGQEITISYIQHQSKQNQLENWGIANK